MPVRLLVPVRVLVLVPVPVRVRVRVPVLVLLAQPGRGLDLDLDRASMLPGSKPWTQSAVLSRAACSKVPQHPHLGWANR